MPRGACDCHAHVIGLPEHYPFTAERSYTPPPAPEEAYFAMHRSLGIERGVLVQVSVHGTDNRLLVETLRRHPQRLRGIAVVTPDAADAELDVLMPPGSAAYAATSCSAVVLDWKRWRRWPNALCAAAGIFSS